MRVSRIRSKRAASDSSTAMGASSPREGGLKVHIGDELTADDLGFGFGKRVCPLGRNLFGFFRRLRQDPGHAANQVQVFEVALRGSQLALRQPIDESM